MRKLYLLLALVFIIPSVIAADFDNGLTTDTTKGGKYSELVVKNAFGLGSDVARLQVLDDGGSCFIDCYAIFNITLYTPSALPVNFDFTKANGQLTSKTFNYYTRSRDSKDVVEPHYKEVCGNELTVNGTTRVCHVVNDYNTTKEVVTYDWKKYKGDVMPVGSYTYKVEAKRQVNEDLDLSFGYLGISSSEIRNHWLWWDEDWAARKPLTILGGNDTFANFTVFVNVSYDSDMSVNFSDIRFVNGSCDEQQTLELKFEQAYTINSNSANFWVLMPTLKPGANNICMYYNNPTATSASDPYNSWDAYYLSVWHLDGNTVDSKGHKNGTFSGSGTVSNLTNCKFGSCYSFKNDNDCLVTDATYDNMAEMTLEGYALLQHINTGDYQAIGGADAGSGNRAFVLHTEYATDDMTWVPYTAAGAGKDVVAANSQPENTWRYWAATTNGKDDLFMDLITWPGQAFADTTDVSTEPFSIGCSDDAGSQEWEGELDEIRFSTIKRNKDWTDRTYNNTNINNFVFGTEEKLGAATITLVTPSDMFITYGPSIFFNCTAVSTGSLLQLVLEINGLNNYTVNNASADTKALTLETTIPFKSGNYSWNCKIKNITGDYSIQNVNNTFSYPSYYFYNYSANGTMYETDLSVFFLNFTYDPLVYDVVKARLFYNGTSGINARTVDRAYNKEFYATRDIPAIITNSEVKKYYWELNLTNSSGTYYINSTIRNQTVAQFLFNYCNGSAGLTTPYLNISFLDEVTGGSISLQILSNFTLWLGNGSEVKNYYYYNTTESANYKFCMAPQNRTVYVNATGSIIGTTYPYRTFAMTTRNLTNISRDYILYALGDNYGLYVKFQIINLAELPVEDATVTITDMTNGQTSSLTTDSAGIATFFMNTLRTYTIDASKTGYGSASLTIVPAETSYTIQLGGTSISSLDYTKGITYSIGPGNILLNNNTNYKFNFTITSSVYELEEYGFVLGNGTVTFTSQNDTTITGGIVNASYNTVKNKTFIMDYYYVINGTMLNFTKIWTVADTQSYSGFGLFKFFQDLSTYTDGNGIFGLKKNSFSMQLIIYLIIFGIVGVVSYKFGFMNTILLTGLTFGLVFIFDIGFGLILNPIRGIPHFVTIFTGFIFIGAIIREVMK